MLRTVVIFILPFLVNCNPQKPAESPMVFKEVQLDERKEVVCFVYHRFGDGRHPSTNTSTQHFEAHLSYLKNHGYQVLSLSAAIDYLKSEAPLQKTAVITIDDGFKSFGEQGLPILQKFGFPATLFINTKTVGAPDYMTWEEVNEAKDSNVEIGNHSHSHSFFLNMTEEKRYVEFEKEIKWAQQLIKENTNTTPQVFAYPYGELDPKMRNIVYEAGFKAAAAQNSGIIYGESDLMQCPRFPMSESYSALHDFAAKAKTKALRIEEKAPSSFILNTDKPSLSLQFKNENLLLDQLQCFIQGSSCDSQLTIENDSTINLQLKAETPITGRRRPLYTVTVPDEEGTWHWFSHLWINAEVR